MKPSPDEEAKLGSPDRQSKPSSEVKPKESETPSTAVTGSEAHQTEEKKGFLRTVFGYFKKGEKAEDQKVEEGHTSSNLSSSNHTSSVPQVNQHVGTPRGEEDDEPSEIDMSLCGHIISDSSITGGEQILRAFEDYKVSFEDFCKNPKALL